MNGRRLRLQPAATMSELTNPSDIARETLRLLASRRVAPNPENYRRYYLEIGGQPEAPPAVAPAQWAKLILELLRQWENRQAGLTTARTREALERVLGAPGADTDALANKLRYLVQSWASAAPAGGGEIEVAGAPVAAAAAVAPSRVEPQPPFAAGEDPVAQFREWLARTLEYAVVSQLGDAPELATEAQALARAVRQAHDREALRKLAAALKQFWFKLEMRGNDGSELRQALLRLLSLLITNTHELVSEDQWLSGQIGMLQDMVDRPLSLRSVSEAESRLKEVLFKQGTLRNSLTEAKAAVKQLIASFIERMGDLSQSTEGYHARLESYSHKIRQTDDIVQLNVVLDQLMQDTRNAQLDATRTRDDLLLARRQVEAAEQKVRDLEQELEKVSELVLEDALTGVLNRRGLEDAYAREEARAQRVGTPLCLGMLDIDNFKQFNDTWGHQTGDGALQHLVRVVRDTMRPSDTLARYGGEEFVMLLPDTGLDEANTVLVRLQRNLTTAFFLHQKQRLMITFSAGVAARRPDETLPLLLERADQALYQAKRNGKNRVCTA
jgi:diguanylate cyclase